MADRPLVVSIEDMDDDTFQTHFEKRHHDQLPGLPNGFVPYIDSGTLNTYRIFHEKLHELYQLGEPHEHEE